MKWRMATTVLGLSVFASATALAHDDATGPDHPCTGHERRGIELGARIGASQGWGPVLYSNLLGRNVLHTQSGNIAIPLIVDVGYRINNWVYIGAFAEGAWVSVKEGGKSFCADGATDCLVRHYVLGGQARFHWMPHRRFDPSVGIGVAYQWLHESSKQGPAETSRTFRGLQWVTASFYGDYTIARGFVVGPFVTAALGQYTMYSAEVSGAGPLSGKQSGSIDELGETRVHVWTTIGVRGAFTAHL